MASRLGKLPGNQVNRVRADSRASPVNRGNRVNPVNKVNPASRVNPVNKVSRVKAGRQGNLVRVARAVRLLADRPVRSRPRWRR